MRRVLGEEPFGVPGLPDQRARDEILEVVVGRRPALATDDGDDGFQVLPGHDAHRSARFHDGIFGEIPKLDEHAQRFPKIEVLHLRMRQTIRLTAREAGAIVGILQPACQLAPENVVLKLASMGAGPPVHKAEKAGDRVAGAHVAQLDHRGDGGRRDDEHGDEGGDRPELLPVHSDASWRRMVSLWRGMRGRDAG
jgi:hypothetical protein